MSGCHQTRPAARRERTWLALSRSRALGAAMRDRSFDHGGSWARTISESKNVFCFFVCVCLCACVFVLVCLWTVNCVPESVVVVDDAVSRLVDVWSTAKALSKLSSPFGVRSQSRVPSECGAQWVDNFIHSSTKFPGSQQVL